MKIAFIGTPYFAATFLKTLFNSADELGIEIPVVLTQPDQPQGRKKVLTPSPVRVMAESLGLPVITKLQEIRNYECDLALLFAYGEIIPQSILDYPEYGFWNIHPSLLPKYRGASPITYPILLGEASTGVTLMQMDAELDHGPVLAQAPFSIPQEATRKELEAELTDLAFTVFKNTFSTFKAEKQLKCQEQIHAQATFTRVLSKQDGFISTLTLNKALNGEIITQTELPEIIVEFYRRNAGIEKPFSEYSASQVVFNAYRALID